MRDGVLGQIAIFVEPRNPGRVKEKIISRNTMKHAVALVSQSEVPVGQSLTQPGVAIRLQSQQTFSLIDDKGHLAVNHRVPVRHPTGLIAIGCSTDIKGVHLLFGFTDCAKGAKDTNDQGRVDDSRNLLFHMTSPKKNRLNCRSLEVLRMFNGSYSLPSQSEDRSKMA